MTSSRRSCSKSTSMSGGSLRSLRYEALEQHVHPHRIDLGDAERETHRRVGRRAAALAEDAARAGEADDVVHGQEKRLVAEFGNQRQFVLDLLVHFPRRALRPAPARALHGQLAQPARWRVAFRHQLARILVLQLAEIEACSARRCAAIVRAVPSDRSPSSAVRVRRWRSPFGNSQAPASPMVTRWRMAVSVSCTMRRRRCMHVHVAGGEQGQAELFPQCRQRLQARTVIGAAVQFHRQPGAFAEQGVQPFGLASGSGVLDGIHKASAPGKPLARSARVRW